MNFLEELTSEWYEYNGYFCRKNIRYGKPSRGGGYVGEIDVVAYHPKTKEFIHIECSADAWSWEKKRVEFRKKFLKASKYYSSEFPFYKKKVRKIVITGYSYPRLNAEDKMNFGGGVEIILVPNFIKLIVSVLSEKDPWNVGIHESTYPLLRAIQYGTFYLLRDLKSSKD